MSEQPQNTAIIDPATGKPTTVPTSQIVQPQSAKANLGGFFDMEELGIDADPEAYADSFKLTGLPDFTFRIRMVSAAIKAHDAGFALRAAKELGIIERAAKSLERDGVKDADSDVIEERALQMMGLELYRSTQAMSTRFDELLNERYNAVIIGNPDSKNPAEWGGLVKWFSPSLPFTIENARAGNIRLKVQLFTRIMALAQYGTDDAGFRPAGR